jgi:ketosteroid isomerase-like protein
MRTLLRVLLSLLACGATWSQTAADPSDAEKAVAALEHEWLMSERNNTPEVSAAWLAEKFVYTGESGRSNKQQYVATLRKIKFSSAEDVDVKFTAFGDVVVATGEFVAKGTDSGKAFSEHTRWTDLWVKMPNGKWQCVSSQDTPVK